MVGREPPQALSEDPVLASIPLYERIKIQLYVQYEQCLNLMFSVNYDLTRRRVPRDQAAFISSVIRLYMTLAPKIDYPKLRDKDGVNPYEALRGLHYYAMNPYELKLKDAKEYFILMRWLLEDLGVTKIKTPQAVAGKVGISLHAKS